MSLIDRLAGRKSPNGAAAATPTATPEAVTPPPSPSPAAPIHTGSMPATGSMRAGSSMYSRGGRDEEKLSAVDQLKIDLHHRLIERLDLEALEQIKDEGEVVHQIRLAVGEFLREESTPLSQAEREEIVEQVVWEI